MTSADTSAPAAPAVSGVVRAMTWRDIPEVAALEVELFGGQAWSPATWWAELAERPRRSYVVLAGPGGSVWGYAGLDHGGEVADVMTIAVSPLARGRGMGSRLLSHLMRLARTGGAARLMLEVRADNETAVRMYARHGLQVVHTRRRYYRPDGVDALVMRTSLEGEGGDEPARWVLACEGDGR